MQKIRIFDEVIAQPQKDFLLDVLFAESHYPVVVESNGLLIDPDFCQVGIPGLYKKCLILDSLARVSISSKTTYY